jgi:hypothetical protein
MNFEFFHISYLFEGDAFMKSYQDGPIFAHPFVDD